jgi:hypothetical protein
MKYGKTFYIHSIFRICNVKFRVYFIVRKWITINKFIKKNLMSETQPKKVGGGGGMDPVPIDEKGQF